MEKKKSKAVDFPLQIGSPSQMECVIDYVTFEQKLKGAEERALHAGIKSVKEMYLKNSKEANL
jgi:hypothetical protein